MVNKYLALFRAAWGISLEYRAEGLVWMMTNLLSVIMLLVWLNISRNGPVNGFSSGDFIAYYMVGLLVRHLTAAWASYELDFDIVKASVSATAYVRSPDSHANCRSLVGETDAPGYLATLDCACFYLDP